MDTAKSSGVSYLLWLLCFAGFFGIHRFYLGKWGTGLLWFFTLGLLGVGQVIDLFLIPGIVDRTNRRLAQRGELLVGRPAF